MLSLLGGRVLPAYSLFHSCNLLSLLEVSKTEKLDYAMGLRVQGPQESLGGFLNQKGVTGFPSEAGILSPRHPAPHPSSQVPS